MTEPSKHPGILLAVAFFSVLAIHCASINAAHADENSHVANGEKNSLPQAETDEVKEFAGQEKNRLQAEGATVYQRLCSNCHGGDGHPSASVTALFNPPPTDLVNAAFRYGEDVDDVISSITNGTGKNMFRFNNRLSEEQIKAVALYVLELRNRTKASSLQ